MKTVQFKILFVVSILLFCSGNFKCQAQSFSNMENVGQYAFSIVQKLNSISREQFVTYFSSAKNVYEHVTGENMPASILQENYLDLQRKARNSGISWHKVKYNSFKSYPPVDENGVLGYKGRLYLQYEGKEFNVVVIAIQYEGRYYLLSIQ